MQSPATALQSAESPTCTVQATCSPIQSAESPSWAGGNLSRQESPSLLTLPDGRQYRRTRKLSNEIREDLAAFLVDFAPENDAYIAEDPAERGASTEQVAVIKKLLGDIQPRPEEE